MPSGVTDFGAEAWLSALFGVTGDISGYYVALCTSQPGIAMDGAILAAIEPSGGYARQHIAAGGSNWSVNGGNLVNDITLDFGTPSADWGILTHFALCSAVTAGDVYSWGEFLNPAYAVTGTDLAIPPGGISLGLTSLDNSIAI